MTPDPMSAGDAFPDLSRPDPEDWLLPPESHQGIGPTADACPR